MLPYRIWRLYEIAEQVTLQAWIRGVLWMRRLKTSLWDVTANSRIAQYLGKLLPVMMPGSHEAPGGAGGGK